MSLLARMVLIQAGRIGKKDESRGQAILVTAEAEAGNTTTSEVWQGPGVIGVPPDGAYGIRLPVGAGSFDAVVAVHNYALAPPALAKGEAMFHSTNADGSLLKASIKARADGTLEINGTGKFLVTHAELNTALQAMLTLINANFATKLNGAGAAGTATLDITLAKASTLKTGG